VTAALRVLTYGILADLVDDQLAMGESTTIMCVKRFVVAIVQLFGSTYLRSLTEEDTTRLLEQNMAQGFIGMIGSIYCMHWSWMNYPTARQRQFKGHKKDSTIILEAVADKETLWNARHGQ
jgi:hypothetical protein